MKRYVLYLCKDVETFGSGIKKIYSLCDSQKVGVHYTNNETDFTLEFSRIDRNTMPSDGIVNGTDGTITDVEVAVLNWLRENPYLTAGQIVTKSGKSLRTVNRIIFSLKTKN